MANLQSFWQEGEADFRFCLYIFYLPGPASRGGGGALTPYIEILFEPDSCDTNLREKKNPVL